MGAPDPGPRQWWTKAEEEILRHACEARYTIDEIHAFLPNRTVLSIHAKAIAHKHQIQRSGAHGAVWRLLRDGLPHPFSEAVEAIRAYTTAGRAAQVWRRRGKKLPNRKPLDLDGQVRVGMSIITQETLRHFPLVITGGKPWWSRSVRLVEMDAPMATYRHEYAQRRRAKMTA